MTPSLQTLHLSHCSLDWDTLPVSGLKELVITEPKTHATVDSIVKILQTVAPTLEQLELRNIFANPEEPQNDTLFGIIHLEKLNSFKLTQEYRELIALLLTHVTFPRRITLQISIREWAESDLIPALIASRNMESWPLYRLDVFVAQENWMHLRLLEDGQGR